MLIDTLTTTPNIHIQKGLEDTKNKLINYYRSSTEKLNYEFPNSSEYELVFITGKNTEESDVGIFHLPILFTTVSNKKIIFVDVRSAVKYERNPEFIELRDIIKDSALFDLKLTHIKLVCYYLDKEVFDTEYLSNTIKIFSNLLAGIISNNLRLDVNDSDDLKHIVAFYYASIVYPDKDLDSKIILVARAASSIRNVDAIANLLRDVPTSITKIDDLIDLIKNNLPNSRAAKLNRTTMYMLMSSLLFGMEVRHYLTVSMENPILLMSLVYNGYTNRIFKRTPMFSTLKTQATYLDVKEFISRTELYIK